MTTTKRAFSVFLCLLTIFTVLSSTLLQASAYSDTDYYTVTTKANYWYPGSESITVSQSKEEYYSNKAHTKTKKGNALVCTVTCTPISGSGKKTIKESFSGSSKKIKLDKNTTYSVKITYKSVICAYHYGTKKEGYAYISALHKAKLA